MILIYHYPYSHRYPFFRLDNYLLMNYFLNLKVQYSHPEAMNILLNGHDHRTAACLFKSKMILSSSTKLKAKLQDASARVWKILQVDSREYREQKYCASVVTTAVHAHVRLGVHSDPLTAFWNPLGGCISHIDSSSVIPNQGSMYPRGYYIHILSI